MQLHVKLHKLIITLVFLRCQDSIVIGMPSLYCNTNTCTEVFKF